MIEVRDGVSVADAREILRTPRVDEMMSTPDPLLAEMVSGMARGQTMYADGRPIVIAGLSVRDGNKWAWLIATPDIGRYGLRVARAVRRFLDAEHGVVFSIAEPHNHKWLRVLKFKQSSNNRSIFFRTS